MKHKTIVHLLFFVTLGISFSFCNRPKDVLSRKSMESLMYDVYIAEAMIENDYYSFDTPAKKEALINEVFKKHNITQAQWDSSLSWYSDRVDVYLKINDSVKAKLQQQQRKAQQVVDKYFAQERAIAARFNSPSYIPRLYSFCDVNPKNGFWFRLDSADIVGKADVKDFNFGFQAMGIPETHIPNLRTMLMLEYKDTTIYRSERVTENREYVLIGEKYILNDTLRKITGFIRLQDTLGVHKDILLKNIFLGNRNDTVQTSIQPEHSIHEYREKRETRQRL